MSDDPIKAAAVSPWLAQDQAYQAHHFACLACISAGKGLGLRCAAGAVLWRAYLEAPDSVSRAP
jgi:hypothetical protein